MLRINSQTGGTEKSRSRKSKLAKKGKNETPGPTLFEQVFKGAQKDPAAAEPLARQERIDEIDNAAQDVLRRPTQKTIERYIDLVRSFLTDVVPEYNRVHERMIRQRLSRRMITLLDTIDDKLQSLAREVMERQRQGLAVSSLFYDIRGIIINILQ